jgi:hypothetical protein
MKIIKAPKYDRIKSDPPDISITIFILIITVIISLFITMK